MYERVRGIFDWTMAQNRHKDYTNKILWNRTMEPSTALSQEEKESLLRCTWNDLHVLAGATTEDLRKAGLSCEFDPGEKSAKRARGELLHPKRTLAQRDKLLKKFKGSHKKGSAETEALVSSKAGVSNLFRVKYLQLKNGGFLLALTNLIQVSEVVEQHFLFITLIPQSFN